MTIPSVLQPSTWWHLLTGQKLTPWIAVRHLGLLPLDLLKQNGVRGLILDVDNTLTDHEQAAIKPEVARAYAALKREFKLVLFSNCPRQRHAELVRIFGLPIVDYGYRKPERKGYERAAQILGLPHESIVAVGDRVLTDILGAQRVGMRGILVLPFGGPEPRGITWLRNLEHWRLRLDPAEL